MQILALAPEVERTAWKSFLYDAAADYRKPPKIM
jgi:hypothetical protein